LNKKFTFEMKIDGQVQTAFSSEGEAIDNQLFFTNDREQTYRFQFNRDETYLYRTGPEELVLVFRLAERSGGTIKSEGFEFVMNVFTKKMEVTASQLHLDYDLLDGNEVVSNHQLLVKWN